MATATQKTAKAAAGNGNKGNGNVVDEPLSKQDRDAAKQQLKAELLAKTGRIPGVVQITAPDIREATFRITGTAPLVMNKFSNKALEEMTNTQLAGSQSKKGRKREPKNFDSLYEGAKHISREGWIGIPAPAFRNAMISACRLVGFKMTLGKMTIFIEPDGFDRDEGTPLVKILDGEPRPLRMAVRLSTGVPDIRMRPIWDKWGAVVRILYDNDIFSLTDITNLMARVGKQVGLLEGRPDSKSSAGMGWGLFDLEGEVAHD